MYSAELCSDGGQYCDPPASLVKVRIKPPLAITQALIDGNSVGKIEVEEVATTVDASVYNLYVGGEPGQDTEADHRERIALATRFIGGILGEVNIINDLSSNEWAQGLTRVGEI
jgi:hypothetical protein